MTLFERDKDIEGLPFHPTHMAVALTQWLAIGLLIFLFQVALNCYDQWFALPQLVKDAVFDLMRGTLRPWQVICWLLVVDIVTPGWGLKDIHDGKMSVAVFYSMLAYCLTLMYG